MICKCRPLLQDFLQGEESFKIALTYHFSLDVFFFCQDVSGSFSVQLVDEDQFLSVARKDCYQVQYHEYNKLKIDNSLMFSFFSKFFM